MGQDEYLRELDNRLRISEAMPMVEKEVEKVVLTVDETEPEMVLHSAVAPRRVVERAVRR